MTESRHLFTYRQGVAMIKRTPSDYAKAIAKHRNLSLVMSSGNFRCNWKWRCNDCQQEFRDSPRKLLTGKAIPCGCLDKAFTIDRIRMTEEVDYDSVEFQEFARLIMEGKNLREAVRLSGVRTVSQAYDFLGRNPDVAKARRYGKPRGLPFQIISKNIPASC